LAEVVSEKNMSILDQACNLQNEIVETRRYLHAHPELSFQEIETAKLAADRLTSLGYKVREKVGKTGVIADFRNKGNAMVAIRADMDALPLEEPANIPYRSQNKGVMHACGHDAHVACALAAAKILANRLPELTGSIRMLMQPAEEASDDEGRTGADRMIEDNALEGVSCIIGLHMDASLPAGKIGISSGPVMAACDDATITIKGKGGHGGFPETTVDAVVLGVMVVQAIQQIVSRRISASDPAVITIGSFQSSSTASNVISDQVVLKASIRTFSKKVQKVISEELEKACGIVKSLGGDYQIDYVHGWPATINDPKITEIVRQAATDLIGEGNVITLPPKPWSEDFSKYQEVVPGTFMFLGCEIEDDQRMHHSPHFDMDESGLYLGSAVLAGAAERLIKVLPMMA
jgi:amidohydrolase